MNFKQKPSVIETACDECGSWVAVAKVVRVINKEMFVCPSCAKKRGTHTVVPVKIVVEFGIRGETNPYRKELWSG
jgi:hypothetical protein